MEGTREEALEMMLLKLIRQLARPEGESWGDPNLWCLNDNPFFWLLHEIEECNLLERDGVREQWWAWIRELLQNKELSAAVDAFISARIVLSEKGKNASETLKRVLSKCAIPQFENAGTKRLTNPH